MRARKSRLIFLATLGVSASSAVAQLRVVSLNTFNGASDRIYPRSPWIDACFRQSDRA